MDERFIRNFPALSPEQQEALREKRVLVAGCGGLGGYIAAYLARLGVGELTLVDGDVFERSNLNRQLLATEETLGQNKARCTALHVQNIHPALRCRAVEEYITAENAPALLAGQDLVMDALDSVETRLLLAEACARAGLSIVHGAVSGWCAQVSTVLPGMDTFDWLYPRGQARETQGVLSFVPGVCAGVQCAEALRLLCTGRGELSGRLWVADLQSMDWHIVPARIL